MVKNSHKTETRKISIKIEKVSHFYTHSIYDLYAADKKGRIVNIERKAPMKGHKQANGYVNCSVRSINSKKKSSCQVHRFVWECFNGIIPEGMVIDHINDIRDDNRLSNLQLMTPQQNNKKAAKNRDYSFVANNHKNKKIVKATNVKTKISIRFKSMYAAGKHLGINPGIISQCCQGVNYCKSGYSKIDGQQYKFKFIID